MITLPTPVLIGIGILILGLLLFCTFFIYKWSEALEDYDRAQEGSEYWRSEYFKIKKLNDNKNTIKPKNKSIEYRDLGDENDNITMAEAAEILPESLVNNIAKSKREKE